MDFCTMSRFWDVNFSFWTAIIYPPVFCVPSFCNISNTDIFFKTSMLWNCAVSKRKGIENILIRNLYVTKFMIIYNSLFLKDCNNIWQPCNIWQPFTSGIKIQWTDSLTACGFANLFTHYLTICCKNGLISNILNCYVSTVL